MERFYKQSQEKGLGCSFINENKSSDEDDSPFNQRLFGKLGNKDNIFDKCKKIYDTHRPLGY